MFSWAKNVRMRQGAYCRIDLIRILSEAAAEKKHMDRKWNTGRAAAAAALVIAGMILSGCVPPASRQAAQNDPAPTEDHFAAAVAHMVPGSTTVMATPYGPDSAVRAGNDYISGLGLTCRRAIVLSGGQEHRLAVCRDRGAWQTYSAIFENSQR